MKFKEALIAHLQGEKVDAMGVEGVWRGFIEVVGDARLTHFDAPSFCANVSFRLAPRTIFVNGVEVPAPEKVAPEYGASYYIADPSERDFFCEATSTNHGLDLIWLERGLVYLNKEDAISRAKAMLLTSDK